MEQVTNSGVVGQHVQLTGNYVAGRDILITETKVFRSKPEFSQINLTPYNRKNYLSPKFTYQVLESIKKKRLILVGGSYGFDKGAFVRHLATLLMEDLPGHTVKEWVYSSDYYSVFSLLAEEKEPSIFILNQILPQNVNYDVAKLASIANKGSHLILVSTDRPVEAWKLSENINKDYWFEIPSDDLYETSELSELLCKYLNKDHEKNGRNGTAVYFNSATQLSSRLSVGDIARKLQVPHKIDLFYRLISNEDGSFSSEIVEQKLQAIATGGGQETISQWFYSLSNTERIIALGTLLFDGLYDDQFFNALGYVVKDYWHLSERRLQVTDYCDLDGILGFYKLETINESRKTLKSKFPNQRIEFLRTIWDSYRRHIILVLPTLVRMVRDSVNTPHRNWELFGNEQRKEKLHNVVSDALSDIALLSMPAVETTLIDLASDTQIEVQAIAAKAIARLREGGRNDLMFSLLDNWQKETRVSSLFSELIQKRTPGQNNANANGEQSHASKEIQRNFSSRSYIRATIGLTLGYASQYDSPGNLSSQIIEILNSLTRDVDEFVRERLKESTLPQLISQHVVQLKDTLFELTEQPDFINPIAIGFANAYNNFPESVLQVVEEWIGYCDRNDNTIGKAGNFSKADKVLMTVFLILGQIDYAETNHGFDIATGYAKLRQLQMKYSHNKFREVVVAIAERRIQQDFQKHSPYLIPIVENFNLSEQAEIVQLFFTIYLDQRAQLPDGEEFVWYNNRIFPIWIDKDRPVTEIENTMFEWLNSSNGVAQQVATRTFITFTKGYDFYEDKRIAEIRQLRTQIQPSTTIAITPEVQQTLLRPTFLMRVIASLSSLPQSGGVKDIIRNILPVALSGNIEHKHYEIIQSNWTRKDENNGTLGSYLRKVSSKYLPVKFVFNVVVTLIIIALVVAIINGVMDE